MNVFLRAAHAPFFGVVVPLYNNAMTALVHGNDRYEVKNVLRRVNSRHWRGQRILIQSLLLPVNRVRTTLFKCYQMMQTAPITGERAES